MTRARWPRSLDPLLEEQVIPHCPETCCFRELCPTDIQAGIASLFQSGDYQRREDCLYWEQLEDLTRRELGIDPPATAAELRTAMGNVRSGAPAGAGDAWEPAA